jgi:hypothetical protein
VDVGIIFSSASTAGTVIFGVQTACSPIDGSATDDAPFNASQAMPTITLTMPANGQWQTLKTAVNTAGCTAGQSLLLKFTRLKDTATGAANIRGFSISYRTNNPEQ